MLRTRGIKNGNKSLYIFSYVANTSISLISQETALSTYTDNVLVNSISTDNSEVVIILLLLPLTDEENKRLAACPR